MEHREISRLGAVEREDCRAHELAGTGGEHVAVDPRLSRLAVVSTASRSATAGRDPLGREAIQSRDQQLGLGERREVKRGHGARVALHGAAEVLNVLAGIPGRVQAHASSRASSFTRSWPGPTNVAPQSAAHHRPSAPSTRDHRRGRRPRSRAHASRHGCNARAAVSPAKPAPITATSAVSSLGALAASVVAGTNPAAGNGPAPAVSRSERRE